MSAYSCVLHHHCQVSVQACRQHAGIQHGCALGLSAAGVHWDPHSPPIAASLLQANVVCVVYDVTKEATIEKVLGPLLES